MTTTKLNSFTFQYLSEAEQFELMTQQLRTIFDDKLLFKSYNISQNKIGHGLAISIDIVTQYLETIVINYNPEYNRIILKDVPANNLKHLLNFKKIKKIQNSLIDIIKTYNLKSKFQMERKYEELGSLAYASLIDNHTILMPIQAKKPAICLKSTFKFNDKLVSVSIDLLANEDKVTLGYYKTTSKTTDGRITKTSYKEVTLEKSSAKAFEQCFYDLYLKEEFNMSRRTKAALKVVEMLII